MSVVAVVVVVVVAIFAASLLGAWLRGGTAQNGGDTGELRAEMQRLLTAQAQGFSAQLGQVTQLVTQQMSEMRKQLEEGVASTGRITVDAQREVSEQLRSSNAVMNKLTDHLGKVQESGRELTQAAQAMQTVLGGPKQRGVVGEAQLDSLLGDVLPRASYETDHRFSNGETVAAALHAGGKWIAIDADFPIAEYRNAVENGEAAKPKFAEAVRERVDEISAKYILAGNETPNLALMFVPSESAFYEVLVTSDEKGALDDYCRQKHVLPVSPNGLHAYLSAILVALKGTESEENARRMLARLDDVKKALDDFAAVHSHLGQQLEVIGQSYEDAGQQLQRTLAAIGDAAEEIPAQPGRDGARSEETPALAAATPNHNEA
jgi:DNA recombination protein RmuC